MITSLPNDILSEIAKFLTPKSGLAFSWTCSKTFHTLTEQRETWKSQLIEWKTLPIPQLIAREIAKEVLQMEPTSIRLSYVASHKCDLSKLDRTGLLICERRHYGGTQISFCNLLTCDHQNCRLKDFVLCAESFLPVDILTYIFSTKPFSVRVDLPLGSFVSENSRLSYAGWSRSGFVYTIYTGIDTESNTYYLHTNGYSSLIQAFHLQWKIALKRSYTRRWLPRRLRSCKKDVLNYIIEKLEKHQCKNLSRCTTDCRWWHCLSVWDAPKIVYGKAEFVGWPLSRKAFDVFENMYGSWNNRDSEFIHIPQFDLE